MKKRLCILIPLLLLALLLLAACADKDADETKPVVLPDPTGQAAPGQQTTPTGVQPAEPGGTAAQTPGTNTGQPDGPPSSDGSIAATEDPDEEEGGIPVEDEVVITVTGNVVIGGN